MALMNRHLSGVETVFLPGDPGSSTCRAAWSRRSRAWGGCVRPRPGHRPDPAPGPSALTEDDRSVWGWVPTCSNLGPWLRRWYAVAEKQMPRCQGVVIRPDPRSPLVVDTRELGRRPGAMRKIHRDVEAPVDLGTDVIGVPEGSELELDLRLESVMEGVLVSGAIRGRAAGECVRCLDDVELALRGDLQELYVYPEPAPEGRDGRRVCASSRAISSTSSR